MPGLLGRIDIATALRPRIAAAAARARSRARCARSGRALALLLSLAGAAAAAQHAPPARRRGAAGRKQAHSEPGSADTAFGFSVAVSADGDTALVGTRRSHGAAGAVWVFVRSDGVWTQQGPALVGGEEAEVSEGGGCAGGSRRPGMQLRSQRRPVRRRQHGADRRRERRPRPRWRLGVHPRRLHLVAAGRRAARRRRARRRALRAQRRAVRRRRHGADRRRGRAGGSGSRVGVHQIRRRVDTAGPAAGRRQRALRTQRRAVGRTAISRSSAPPAMAKARARCGSSPATARRGSRRARRRRPAKRTVRPGSARASRCPPTASWRWRAGAKMTQVSAQRGSSRGPLRAMRSRARS